MILPVGKIEIPCFYFLCWVKLHERFNVSKTQAFFPLE